MAPSPDPARSDEALRSFADHLLAQIRPAYRQQPDTDRDLVTVTLAIGDRSDHEPVPFLFPAATLDEVARVLGALSQIRGAR